MQNTIIKEFADDSRVFTAAFQQGGSHGETREWLEVFWSSYHLGGNLIWDATGVTGGQLYGQPSTGLPFGRGFIIDQDGRVVRAYFGHQPQMVIDTIHEMLTPTRTGDHTPPPPLQISSYPNPFNPRGVIAYELPTSGTVRIEIVDLRGRLVRVLKRGVHEESGRHEVVWDGTDASGRSQASGAYVVKVSSGPVAASWSLTLVR